MQNESIIIEMSNDFTIFGTTSIKSYFDDFDASNLSDLKDFQQSHQLFFHFTFQQSSDNHVLITLSTIPLPQSIKRGREQFKKHFVQINFISFDVCFVMNNFNMSQNTQSSYIVSRQQKIFDFLKKNVF